MTYGVIIGERGDASRWRNERRRFRRGPGTPYRGLQTLKHLAARDRGAVLRFLRAPYPGIGTRDRLELLRAFITTTNALRGYHTLSEILEVGHRILRRTGRSGLTVVEAGAGSGASTAKLSLLVRAAGGHLHVFDTFRGIPENDERHQLLDGTPLRFVKGAFRGRLGAVERRVREHGAIEVCSFHKGLFADTMPGFVASLEGPLDVVLLDVDLVGSTRTCVTHLYPELRASGVLFSQDGHIRATRDLLGDDAFWRDEVGCARPTVHAAGSTKLLSIEATTSGV